MVAATVSRPPPAFSRDRRSGVKLFIVPLLPFVWLFWPVEYATTLKSLPGGLVEQMNQRRFWFQPDLVARLELMTLAEDGDDLFAAQLGEYLRFRSRRFDHHDFRLRTIIGNREMLRPHAIDRGPAVGIGGCRRQRQLDAVRPFEAGAAVGLDLAFEEIHRRRADEARDKLVVRPVVKFERRAGLFADDVIHH